MNKEELVQQIFTKRSMLCVGLDTDPGKIPAFLRDESDPVFAFNKAVIDATKEYAVAYKLNTAFYEAQGVKGWESLQKTLEHIPGNCFSIADAKRGDIGNTAEQYAKTFFYTYPFDSITVNPYMGVDSVAPFLQFPGKWAIVLAITSNKGSEDFQTQRVGQELLYHKVMRTAAAWGTTGNTMFVTGATKKEQLKEARVILPGHFFLVPGVGTQGGDVASVCQAALNKEGGLLINVSRAVIYATDDQYFAEAAHEAAGKYQKQMREYV